MILVVEVGKNLGHVQVLVARQTGVERSIGQVVRLAADPAAHAHAEAHATRVTRVAQPNLRAMCRETDRSQTAARPAFGEQRFQGAFTDWLGQVWTAEVDGEVLQ